RTDVGASGTRTEATSFSGTLYSTYKPFDPWFIDAILGFGTLGYDNHRTVADDGATVFGSRSGTFWYGALSTGYDLRLSALKLTPYIRADFVAARLDQYSEQGPSTEQLTYASTDFSTVAGAIGLRGAYDIPMAWGVLTPIARLEYRRAYDGSLQQSMYYTDL